MSTAVAFLEEWRDLMRARGHAVLETAGWRTRDAEPGHGYDPTRMFLEHHDASTVLAGNWGALPYVTAKKLAQLVFSRDGQAILVAAGITWHAGVGGPFADIPANQGNYFSLAVEVANSGSEPYAAELTRLIVDAEACWCLVAQRHADRVRGHKEWATPKGRKTDPSIDMNQRRADVAAAIATGGPVAPAPQEYVEMKVIQSEKRGIALVGPGYYRQLVDAEDVTSAVMLWGQPHIDNERRFDVWVSQAINGTGVSGTAAALTGLAAQVSGIKPADVDEDALAALLAPKLSGTSKAELADALRQVLREGVGA